MYKLLHCPNCNDPIDSGDIHLTSGLAKCTNCHVVLRIQEEFDPTPAIGAPQEKQEIYIIPKGIEMLRLPSELSIDMSWRHTFSFSKPQMIVALSFFGTLGLFLYIALSTGSFHVLGIIVLFAAIGFGLLLWALASIFNTTYLTVDQKSIRIQHRPFKLLYQEYEIPVDQVEQIYVKEYVSTQVNSTLYTAFAIRMKMTGGKDLRLLKGINKVEQAQFIEQEMERFAGIKDREVRGEYKD